MTAFAQAISTAERLTGRGAAYEIAAVAGISAQYYSDIKRAKRLPPPETVCRLADALDVPVEPLLWHWVNQQMGAHLANRVALWPLERPA